MADHSLSPTPKNYPALIEKATPALYALIYQDDDLSGYDLDVINTVCVIMIVGRQCLYTRRKKPFKDPSAVFSRWARDLWTIDPRERQGEISYIKGKVDLIQYLVHGTRLLRIDMKGEKYGR